ncbi:MAG: DUF4097 family beta strand repeat protein [Bacteroidetes bacterium]|jgi:beta-lactamase regulating signal transducer with metallopeptidase domain|nr:DUF4097 family beta strand repeat protein [Bacteroidota bacterium]
MNELVHSLLHPDVALPLLAFLADLTIKSLLILALAGVATSLLRRASAATRHLVWTLALCSVLLLPVLSVVGPSWHVLPDWHAVTDRIAITPPSVAPEVPSLPLAPETADAPAATPAPPAPSPPAEAPAASPRVETQNALWQALGSLVEAARQAHWSVWLMLLWGLGAMLVVGRLLAGAVGVAWMARRARPIDNPTWRALLDDLGRQLGLDRRVQLLQSARTSMPMTWGLLRPVILLPQGADDWSDARKRCVLAHEMAHVQRWDCLTQGLAQLACALVWWNPLCWVAARRMRVERELACDDQVLACDTRPSEYATHLLDVARTSRRSFVSPIHAVSMARPSQLEGRILAILDPERRRATLGRVTLGIAIGLAALLVVPVSALRPSSDAVPEQPPPQAMVAVSESESASDLIEWEGSVAPDATVDIFAGWGDVHVGPSEDASVRVRGYRASGEEDAQIRVDERGNALVICTTTDDAQPCSLGEGVSAVPGRNDTQVDLKVLVPPTVRLQVRSVDGNISVAQHQHIVTAETHDGDISVRTTGYAQARTDDGNIHIEMGRADWAGKLDVVTQDGDIEVVLPSRPDVDVYAESKDGWVRSDFALKERRRAAGMLLWGAVGQGDRRLTLQTDDGAITLRAARQTAAPAREAAEDPTWATLRHASTSVRIRVAEVLGRERDDSSVPLLSTLLRQDENPKVRKVAAWALGEIGAPEGLPALTDALDDAQPTVRAKAAWAMGEVRDVAAGPALADAVRHDPDATVRTMAVWALGELGDERAVPVLRTALDDTDRTVRDKARWALHEIGATVADEAEVDVKNHENNHETEARHVRNSASNEARAEVHIDATLDSPRTAELVRRVLTNVGHIAREVTVNEESLARVLQGEAPRASASYRRAMRAAGIETDDDDVLLMAQVLGVEPTYAQAIREAGYTFCLEEIIKMYLVDVEPADLRTLSAAGYDDLDLEAIVQLHTQGVDGAYVQALASVGYRELCPEDLVAWRQHGVDRAFLQDLASVGYRDLCPEEVLALRVHGIDVAFVREHVGRGSALPPIDEIVERKLADA